MKNILVVKNIVECVNNNQTKATENSLQLLVRYINRFVVGLKLKDAKIPVARLNYKDHMEDEITSKLKIYYERHFPYEELFNLIEITDHREISFTKNSAYIRNLEIGDYDVLKQTLTKLIPEKFDIGGIFPNRGVTGGVGKQQLKELVFDVDLTDYPRKCCLKKAICEECFSIIRAAIKILDFSLKTEFGFEKYRFFFSGGRGMHCWVFDDSAKKLNNFERRSIALFFQTVVAKTLYPTPYAEILRQFSSEPLKEMYEGYFLRLDVNVTADIKHLLKSPYCVHPSTKMICVNLDPRTIDSIRLVDMPSLDQVIMDPNLLVRFVKHL